MKLKKLLVAIPAFNEEASIGEVLDKIPKKIAGNVWVEVVVVDDGSSDKTSFIAKEKGVVVLKHIINRGLGAALTTAFEYAKIRRVELLVTLDADGQHDPKDIGRLIKPIVKGCYDVVIGSRLIRDYSLMPPFRRIINILANVLTYFLSGIWSTDSQSGFRAFSKRAINKIKLVTQGMEVSSEFFGQIKENNLNYTEISIRPIYTSYSLAKGQRNSNALNVFWKLLINFLRR